MSIFGGRRVDHALEVTARSSRLHLAALSCMVATLVSATWATSSTFAQAERVLEFRYTPAENAQIAIWLENMAGQFVATVALTESVATRGLGNRPGASQMNSGFRWPYGRREGVLPIWAHRRASAPGARPFKRVIFQKRSEGFASRTSADASPDAYFCLSFNTARSRKDALDAVSCASTFNSDKGRFITETDLSAGYAEPYEDAPLAGRMQPLTLDSLYPPRRDVTSCVDSPGQCDDHADAASFNAHAHEIMPDIDAVSMATPQGGAAQSRLFTVPSEWPDAQYRACLEINIEGDYNVAFDDARFPTPRTPAVGWDSYTHDYGYAYRGQPSVVYCVPFDLHTSGEASYRTSAADGSTGNWDTFTPEFGRLASMDGMSNDPLNAPGSGGDRLRQDERGDRLSVVVKGQVSCETNAAPSGVTDLQLHPYPHEQRAHEWAALQFDAASDDRGVYRYEVRVATEPIVDEASFMRGLSAKTATTAAEALEIPTNVPAGGQISTNIGGLSERSHYYIGVRASDGCARAGAIAVAEYSTGARVFATVTPCFIATAAYGTPLAAEISVLRRLRDRQLASHAIGRRLVEGYNTAGPKLAAIIREHDTLRALTRVLLTPLVALARALTD